MNTQKITELHETLRAAIARRNQAQDAWRRTMIEWSRGQRTNSELDHAADELDRAQAEVDRLVDSPAIGRIGVQR